VCKKIVYGFLIIGLYECCSLGNAAKPITATKKAEIAYDSHYRTIHVFVALCDNKYQGIVPVPAGIGNGQAPETNLYWGCGYGVKTYFKRSANWKLMATKKGAKPILETLVFKHNATKTYLIAHAYDGQYIQSCTQDFLNTACGKLKDTLSADNKLLGTAGNSELVAYIGHNGLMDFSLTDKFNNSDEKKRNTIILACYSKSYFSKHLAQANINPLVWSTHLMSPEAYTLHDAIEAYLAKSNNDTIRQKAAEAYNKYQKCGLKAAKNLLVTGW
jgi:hypothetical protein